MKTYIHNLANIADKHLQQIYYFQTYNMNYLVYNLF